MAVHGRVWIGPMFNFVKVTEPELAFADRRNLVVLTGELKPFAFCDAHPREAAGRIA